MILCYSHTTPFVMKYLRAHKTDNQSTRAIRVEVDRYISYEDIMLLEEAEAENTRRCWKSQKRFTASENQP